MRASKKRFEKADDGVKFEVGDRHENMKGMYEVVSIQNESMVIRWDDGNEVVTTVEQQKRIMERMAYEKEVQQQEQDAQVKKKSKK